MKPIKTLISAALALLVAMPASAEAVDISARNIDVHFVDSTVIVTADLILDNLKLKSNHQVMITPIVESGELRVESGDSQNGQQTTDNGQRTTRKNFRQSSSAGAICTSATRGECSATST